MRENGGHEVLVRMQGIEKVFPGVHALNDCQFELLAGEVHALVGENGAGKSTLMKVLTGVYQKDAGDIFISGNRVDIPDTRAAQALGISIIHQGHRFHQQPERRRAGRGRDDEAGRL